MPALPGNPRTKNENTMATVPDITLPLSVPRPRPIVWPNTPRPASVLPRALRPKPAPQDKAP